MFVKYDIVDGKVIAKDERNYPTYFNWTTNIEEILEVKNLIEEVRKQIYYIERCKNILNKDKNSTLLSYGIKGLLTLATLESILCLGYYEFFDKILDTNVLDARTINIFMKAPIFTVGVVLVVASVSIYKIYLAKCKVQKLSYDVIQYKEDLFKKRVEELEKQLEVLEYEALNIEKENAYDIAIDTSNLEKWKSYLDSFHPLINNIKRYQEYYNKGTLDAKLAEEYRDNDEVIHLIRDFYKRNHNC